MRRSAAVLGLVVYRLKKVCGYSFCGAPLALDTGTVLHTESRRLTKKTGTRMLTKTRKEKTDTPILTGHMRPGFSSVNMYVHPMPTGAGFIPLGVVFHCASPCLTLLRFAVRCGTLRVLCGLDHARFGQDRENLCQTYMFATGVISPKNP